MALSGTIIRLSNSAKVYSKLVWNATQNIANNTSTITAKLYYYKELPSQYDSGGYWNGSITINGKVYKRSGIHFVCKPGAGDQFVFETEPQVITHNTDGTKTITISLNCIDVNPSRIGPHNFSENITLDAIPRRVEINTAQDFSDMDNPTITYYDNGATSSLQAGIAFRNGPNADIAFRDIPKDKNSYTFNLTEAERNVLRQGCVDANSKYVFFIIKSVVEGNTFYSSKAQTLTISNGILGLIPSYEVIDKTTLDLTGNNQSVIEDVSTITTHTGAFGRKFATITSQGVRISHGDFEGETQTLYNIDEENLYFYAEDSRKNKKTSTLPLKNIHYIRPYMKLTTNAQLSHDDKITIHAKAQGDWFNASFGKVQNAIEVYCRYETQARTYSDWIPMQITSSGNRFTATADITELSLSNSYKVQGKIIDKLNIPETTPEQTVQVKPIFQWDNRSFDFNLPINVNGYANITSGFNTIPLYYNDVNDETQFNRDLDKILERMPVGAIQPISFSVYPAIDGTTYYGILFNHGSGYAGIWAFSYFNAKVYKDKRAGTWQNAIRGSVI